MKYRSFFAVLISIGILFSLLSCMKRPPVKIGDASRIASVDIARISVPEDIEVVSVDGQQVKSIADSILSTIEEIHVTPGEHEMVVRYIKYWPYGNNRRKEIKAENVALKFYATRGGLYMLTYPGLNDITEAEKFAQDPNIWVEKAGSFSDMEKGGERVSRSIEMSELGRYTEPERPPIMERPPVMERDTDLKEEWYRLSEKEKEEFRKWLEWNNMSEEEKEKFREWTNKNDKE